MSDQERSFGDGQPFASEGVDYYLDQTISWVEKVYPPAISNGCTGPDALINSWLDKLYQVKERINATDPQIQEAAHQAFLEYTLQNSLYDQLIDMVAKKADPALLVDICVTPHVASGDLSKIEVDRVPKSRLEGRVTGFANDDAFEIVESISKLFYNPKIASNSCSALLPNDSTSPCLIKTFDEN